MAIYMWREPAPVTRNGSYRSPELGLISVSANGSTWITMSDKNLGATTVYNVGDTLSEANCGKFYQRGNNYGFPFTGATTTSSTKVNTSSYGPTNYYSDSTFITADNNPYDWSSNQNDNLRGDTTDTLLARRGPCPEGFHVPTYNDWYNVISNSITGGYGSEAVRETLLLPFAGGLRVYYGTPINVGTTCFYWTSVADNRNARVLNLHEGSQSSLSDVANRAAGNPIRPFANTPVQPDETRTVLYQ